MIAAKEIIWGNGCKLCAYTGEEWLHVSSGDGWAGRPCPHCVPGGDLYDDREPPDEETQQSSLLGEQQ